MSAQPTYAGYNPMTNGRLGAIPGINNNPGFANPPTQPYHHGMGSTPSPSSSVSVSPSPPIPSVPGLARHAPTAQPNSTEMCKYNSRRDFYCYLDTLLIIHSFHRNYTNHYFEFVIQHLRFVEKVVVKTSNLVSF